MARESLTEELVFAESQKLRQACYKTRLKRRSSRAGEIMLGESCCGRVGQDGSEREVAFVGTLEGLDWALRR